MKSLAKILFVVGVLVVVAYLGLDLFLGRIVAVGVNRFGPGIMGVPVALDSANISPLSGSGSLTGLSVSNPKDWGTGKAVSIGRIHIQVAPFSILGDHIVVKELVIEDAQFDYQTKLISSNIGDLLASMKGSSSGAPQPTAGGKPIRFEVLKFRINSAKISLGVGPTAISLPMPPISIDDLGTAEGGISADQLATAIMRAVAGTITKSTAQAAAHLGSTLGAGAASGAGSAIDSVKSLFGKKN